MFCLSQPGPAIEGMSLAVYSLMRGLVPVFEQVQQSFSEPKVLHVHLPSLQLFKNLHRIRALTDQSEPAEQEELTGAELLRLVLMRHVKAWVWWSPSCQHLTPSHRSCLYSLSLRVIGFDRLS